LFAVCLADAQDKADTSARKTLGDLLSDYYRMDKFVVNSPNLELDWGVSFMSLPEPALTRDFALVFPLEVKYGFTRINTHLDVPDRIYYASDNIFIGNFSSHLKPKNWKENGITTDNWRYGYSYRNGYGYILNGNTPLVLYHAGSLGGSKIDIENPPSDPFSSSLLDIYDIRYKFWSAFEAGAKIKLWGVVNLNASYEHSIVYRDFQFTSWFASSLTEFIPQRLIDVFADELLRQNPDTYPVVNFILKNALSAFIYEMKRRNSYFPIHSERSINYDTYKLGISLIF
jgi:hypothetical protein